MYPPGQEPLIGSARLPLTLEGKGSYKYNRAFKMDKSGQGLIVPVGLPSAEWRWNYVSKSEFAALVALAGGDSRLAFGTTRLWDDAMTINTFSQVVVERPVYEEYTGGIFRDVTLRLSQLK